jgi:hypothetical protein
MACDAPSLVYDITGTWLDFSVGRAFGVRATERAGPMSASSTRVRNGGTPRSLGAADAKPDVAR